MKMVRVLGSDIFQTRLGKFFVKLTFIFYLTLLVAQLSTSSFWQQAQQT
jgi:hypothetical protein